MQLFVRWLGIAPGPQPSNSALWPEAPRLARVSDRVVQGRGGNLISIRIYRPSSAYQLPVLLYMHGGGWATGDLESVDVSSRRISAGVPCVVVSVDYRLAPASAFPDPLDDVDDVALWVAEHASDFGGDRGRLAIGGESAGGNLAAGCCLRARDRGGPGFAAQVLIYPSLDPDMSRPELASNEDPVLTTALLRWSWRNYIGLEPAPSYYAAPALAPCVDGLPTALIITAETDPLRFEGSAYARRLKDAGVAVVHKEYKRLFHGFFGLDHPGADVAMADVLATLKAVWTTSDRQFTTDRSA